MYVCKWEGCDYTINIGRCVLCTCGVRCIYICMCVHVHVCTRMYMCVRACTCV